VKLASASMHDMMCRGLCPAVQLNTHPFMMTNMLTQTWWTLV